MVRAIAMSPHRLATGALLKATPHKAISTSLSYSAVLSSTTLSAEQSCPPSIPKIFDIFDSPMSLRARDECNEPESLKASGYLPAVHVTPRAGSLHSQGMHIDALGLPWSLPPPITFDGPACPPHMSPSTLRERRLRRRGLPSSETRYQWSSAVSCNLTSQSDTLYQLFDGPSRVTRFQYPTPGNERHSFTSVALALCLSSAFGWLALEGNLERSKERTLRQRGLSSPS